MTKLEKGSVVLALLSVGLNVAFAIQTHERPYISAALGWLVAAGWMVIAARWRRWYWDILKEWKESNEKWEQLLLNLGASAQAFINVLLRENQRLHDEVKKERGDKPWLH